MVCGTHIKYGRQQQMKINLFQDANIYVIIYLSFLKNKVFKSVVGKNYKVRVSIIL